MPQLLADDSVFHILQFLDSEFILSVGMRISPQWYKKSLEVELSLDFSSSLNGRNAIRSFKTCPNLHKLTSLNLSMNYIGGEGGKALASCPFMSNLKSLNLDTTRVGYQGGLIALAESPYMSNLTELSLNNLSMGDEVADILTMNTTFQHLKVLSLEDCQLSLKGFNKILSCSSLSKLTSLNLNNNFDLDEDGLVIDFGNELVNLTELSLMKASDASEELLIDLFDSNRFPKMKKLSLIRCCVGNEFVKAISKNSSMSNLTNLTISSLPPEQVDASLIANSPFLSNLTSLTCTLERDGMKKLSSSNHLKQLTKICVERSAIDCFTPSENMKNLTELTLSRKTTTDTLQAIATSDYMRNLKVLDLASTGITNDGLKFIAESQVLSNNLTSLNLYNSKVTHKGLGYFSNSNLKLSQINLGYSQMSSKAAKTIASCSCMKQLTSLDLSHGTIDRNGAEAISNSEYLSSLTELDLGNNSIGDEGFQIICTSPFMKNLKNLSVQMNKLTQASAQSFAQSPYLTQLEVLDMNYNNLCCEGAIILSQSSNMKHVKKLKLSINNIRIKGAQGMASSPYFTNLTSLELDGSGIGPHEDKGLHSNEFKDEGCIALASHASNFRKLTALDLSTNELGPTGVTALIDNLENLKELRAFDNYTKDEDAQVLMQNPNLMKLQTLLLTYNLMSEEVQEQLGNSPYLKYAQCLSLGGSMSYEN